MCSPFLCEGSGQHPAPTWSWCPHSQFMDSMRLDPETVDSLDTYSHIPPQLMEKCAALSVRPDTVRSLVQSMQGAGVVKAVEGGNDVMVSSAVALSAPLFTKDGGCTSLCSWHKCPSPCHALCLVLGGLGSHRPLTEGAALCHGGQARVGAWSACLRSCPSPIHTLSAVRCVHRRGGLSEGHQGPAGGGRAARPEVAGGSGPGGGQHGGLQG